MVSSVRMSLTSSCGTACFSSLSYAEALSCALWFRMPIAWHPGCVIATTCEILSDAALSTSIHVFLTARERPPASVSHVHVTCGGFLFVPLPLFQECDVIMDPGTGSTVTRRYTAAAMERSAWNGADSRECVTGGRIRKLRHRNPQVPRAPGKRLQFQKASNKPATRQSAASHAGTR